MATLSEYKAKGGTSLKRGTINRQLGGVSVKPTTNVQDRPGIVGQFTKKVGDVAGQVASMGGSLGGAAVRFAANTPRYVYEDVKPFLQGVAKTVTGELGRDLSNNNRLQEELNRRTDTLVEQYRTGQMNKENYNQALKDISAEYSELSKHSKEIATQADRGNVVESAAMTAATILTAGDLRLSRVGGRQVFDAAANKGGKEAIKAILAQGATNLERQILRLPVVRTLVERNLTGAAKRLASESMSQYLRREGTHLAANFLIKRPIFYQSNIGDARKAYEGIITGNYPQSLRSSAWLGIQLIDGGPLGVFSKGYNWTKGKFGELSYGRESFIDKVSQRFGINIADDLTRMDSKTRARSEKIWRIAQEGNLRAADNNVDIAVANFMSTYDDALNSGQKFTREQIELDFENWQKADEIWGHAAKAGALKMSPEQAARFTPVRWDSTTRNMVANLKTWDEVQALADKPQSAFGNNNNLMLQLERIFKENPDDTEAISRAVRAIDAASVTPKYIPKGLTRRLAKLGYTMAEPAGGRLVPSVQLDDTRRLVSSAINGTDELFDAAIAPQPEMHAIAKFFETIGVTPRDSNTFAYRELGRSVAARLNGTLAGRHFGFTGDGDQAKGGQAILSRLRQYIEDKPAARGLGSLSTGKSAVTDIRQLTIREIQDALGHADGSKWVKLGRDEAREVARAVAKGYMDVPLELRGLGEKITDTLFAYNPAQKYYSRTQSALRYTYNPFFRVQERSETAILSRAQASNLIWGRGRAQLDDAVRVLDENRIFSGVLPGEAAQDQVLGRITANLTRGQKRDLAGLAMDIADTRGLPLETLARDFPDEIDDALRVVVQYPRKGVLASPLARTLNLVFFPMRYNAKVTMLAAQTLAKQPPAIQKAVLHSGFRLKDWLKSDEGIRWQSEHADAIQLFKWITPVNSIESTFKLLTGPDSIGEVGLLGGLPLGFITQILDGQGIIDMNKPYVDPKTGNVFPDYIPKSTQARAATALGDLINTMFTYPGRVLGLPGKEKTVRDLVKKIIETEGNDFEKRLNEEDLTPVQRAWVRVLKEDASKEALDALYTSPAPGQFNWYTLPPLEFPIRNILPEARPVTRRTAPHKQPRSRRAKPTALPMPER